VQAPGVAIGDPLEECAEIVFLSYFRGADVRTCICDAISACVAIEWRASAPGRDFAVCDRARCAVGRRALPLPWRVGIQGC